MSLPPSPEPYDFPVSEEFKLGAEWCEQRNRENFIEGLHELIDDLAIRIRENEERGIGRSRMFRRKSREELQVWALYGPGCEEDFDDSLPSTGWPSPCGNNPCSEPTTPQQNEIHQGNHYRSLEVVGGSPLHINSLEESSLPISPITMTRKRRNSDPDELREDNSKKRIKRVQAEMNTNPQLPSPATSSSNSSNTGSASKSSRYRVLAIPKRRSRRIQQQPPEVMV